MTAAGVKRALIRATRGLYDHRTLQVAAGLSYYFILAVFPGRILLPTILDAIPLPDLFGYILGAMHRVLPPEAMKIVSSVLGDVLQGKHRAQSGRPTESCWIHFLPRCHGSPRAHSQIAQTDQASWMYWKRFRRPEPVEQQTHWRVGTAESEARG